MSSPFYKNAGGGGGFVDKSPYGSQESPGGGASRRPNSHSLRPVTIKQINDSEQAHGTAEWQIDGSDAPSVTFVAQVRNKAQQATNTAFSLEDGTGHVDARLWSDSSDPDTAAGHEIENDMWVRVQGTIKEFAKKKHVAAQRVRQITDMLEVYYHYCEALAVHLEITRGPAKPSGGATNGHPEMNGSSNVHSDYTMGGGGGGGGGGAANDYSHMPPLQRAIMEYIESSGNPDGCHISAISRAVGGGGRATADQISIALERLSDDGHVYNTLDDTHYQSVNAQ